MTDIVIQYTRLSLSLSLSLSLQSQLKASSSSASYSTASLPVSSAILCTHPAQPL